MTELTEAERTAKRQERDELLHGERELVLRAYDLTTPCPICRGVTVVGGVTGHFYQFHCSACGWTFEVVR